mmetsp:Transcript_3650/g.5108  ORF Transcript_3650/g.5108 Transcript_3650/m.5108 type:complete len:228 (-) Transcript_3650:271-954(-)
MLMDTEMSPAEDGHAVIEGEMSLLSCAQSMIELETSMTNTLANTKPLLDLPTPTTMAEVETILAVARSYSTRTSAPPGWNPNLPVIHFFTPNPLPHQLRKGALGAMQLQMVREERLAKKRRIVEEEKEKKRQEEEQRRHALEEEQDQARDPKKKELVDHYKMEDDDGKKLLAEKRQQKVQINDKNANAQKERQRRLQQQQQHQRKSSVNVSMNLSDSSSSEDEDDSD